MTVQHMPQVLENLPNQKTFSQSPMVRELMQVEYMDYIYSLNRFYFEPFQKKKVGPALIPGYLGHFQLDEASGQVQHVSSISTTVVPVKKDINIQTLKCRWMLKYALMILKQPTEKNTKTSQI